MVSSASKTNSDLTSSSSTGRQPGTSSPLLPGDSIPLEIWFRVGEGPSRTSRPTRLIQETFSSAPRITYLLSPYTDSFGVIKERVARLAAELIDASNISHGKRLVWSGQIYLKPHHSASQGMNRLLPEHNIEELKRWIVDAWKSEAASKQAQNMPRDDVAAVLFVYLQEAEAADLKSALHRSGLGIHTASNSRSAISGLSQHPRGTMQSIQQPKPRMRAANAEERVPGHNTRHPIATVMASSTLAHQGSRSIPGGSHDFSRVPIHATYRLAGGSAALHATGETPRKEQDSDCIEVSITIKIPLSALGVGVSLRDVGPRSALDRLVSVSSGTPSTKSAQAHDLQDTTRRRHATSTDDAGGSSSMKRKRSREGSPALGVHGPGTVRNNARPSTVTRTGSKLGPPDERLHTHKS